MKLTVDSVLSKDETRWSGVRELMLLAIPIVITVGSNTLMTAVDAWMVTQYGGKDYIASIMPAGLLNHVLVSFFIGVVSCVGTFVGQCYGRRELRECSHYAWQGIYLSIFIALGVMAFWPFTPAVFKFMGHSPEVQRLETLYFRLRLWGVGGAVMTVALGAFFYATSRSVIPMVAAILANLFNLVGDYALIFGKLGMPRMGIVGAAIATNIAAWLCALVMLGIFLSSMINDTYATRRTWQWDWRRAKELFRVGWPAGLSMGMDVGSWAVFLCFLVGRFGDSQLAAASITGNILAGSFMPTVALGIAITAIVGQWIGRGDVQRARARYITALKIGIAYMMFMGIIFIIFRRQLIGLFLDEADVIRFGSRFLIFAALFQLFDATAIVTGSALKGAGDTKWPMAVQIIVAWCVFLPLGYVLAFHTGLGVYGGWVGANVYIWVLGTVLFYRFLGGRWKTINIFENAPGGAPTSIEPAGQAEGADREPAPDAPDKDAHPSDLEED